MTLRNHHGVVFFSLIILHLLTISFPSVSAYMFHHGTLRALHNKKLATYRSGQNYKGLSNIKKHFHRLGYIPNARPSNFNNDFDHTLVSAIKTYQKNYRLNVTGEFDQHTLEHLRVPRCGVADIINGSTHSDQVSQFTLFPGLPRWSQVPGQLTFGFEEGGIPIPQDLKNAIVNGLNRWGPVTRTTFRQTTQRPNLIFGFHRRNHGDGNSFDGRLGVLAHAYAPSDGRCHFDADESFVANVRQSPGFGNVDLESVAVHEAGHLLGLGHSFNPNSIMYPSIPIGQRKVNPQLDDIIGIRVLYRF